MGPAEGIELLMGEDEYTLPANSLSTSCLIRLSSEASYSKIRLVWILKEQIPLHYRIVMSAYPMYLATALPSCLCMSLRLRPTSKQNLQFLAPLLFWCKMWNLLKIQNDCLKRQRNYVEVIASGKIMKPQGFEKKPLQQQFMGSHYFGRSLPVLLLDRLCVFY